MEHCIFIHGIDDERFTIPYLDGMTGLQVKRRLKVLTGNKVGQQSLAFHGREIEDRDRLIDRDVHNGDTVLISSFVLMIYLFRFI
jgi:hypothetical protein